MEISQNEVMQLRDVVENFMAKQCFSDQRANDLHYLKHHYHHDYADMIEQIYDEYDLGYTRIPNEDHEKVGG